jgi:hypothetical protein
MPRCSRAWREAAYQIDFRSRIPWEVSGGSLRSPGSCTLSKSNASRVALCRSPFEVCLLLCLPFSNIRPGTAVKLMARRVPGRKNGYAAGSTSQNMSFGPIECKALDVSSCLVEGWKIASAFGLGCVRSRAMPMRETGSVDEKAFQELLFLRTVQTARVESLVRR